MSDFHLAQVNMAQAQAEMGSDIMTGFVNRLDEINALADISPGFIWRLQDEEGDATGIRVFDDPLMLVNISVWEDVAALKNFVYKTVHVELIRDREAWFHKMPAMHQALWWVPVGHIPSAEEAKSKLEQLREEGPSAEAFTFGRPWDKPTV